MGSTRAAAKFGQNAAPENEMTATNLYNTHTKKSITGAAPSTNFHPIIWGNAFLRITKFVRAR